ncbi:MAG: hypothetical protein JW839_07295, partial [Candidatus Lokiarchaeota archaeon]|nr:hypothetical protein [Candidatus Lokiarchaeota archaeon]
VDPAAVGRTEMEQTEDIQHFWLTPAAFMRMAAGIDPEMTAVESDCWNYMAGLTGWCKAARHKRQV